MVFVFLGREAINLDRVTHITLKDRRALVHFSENDFLILEREEGARLMRFLPLAPGGNLSKQVEEAVDVGERS